MELQEENPKETERKISRYLGFAIVFVFVVWASTFFWNTFNLYEIKEFNGGTLGDSFGMVNALFSGLAFALLIYTSLMQREELKLQRKELEENRQELRRTADAQNDLVKLNQQLVEITKIVNQEKIIPNLEFVAWGRGGSKDDFSISLKVKNGEVIVKAVNSKTHQLINVALLNKNWLANQIITFQLKGLPYSGFFRIEFESENKQFYQVVILSNDKPNSGATYVVG